MYTNGQSESFADFDRSGFSVVGGYAFSEFWRIDLTYSLDEEKYTAFTINDNEAESIGLSGSLFF